MEQLYKIFFFKIHFFGLTIGGKVHNMDPHRKIRKAQRE